LLERITTKKQAQISPQHSETHNKYFNYNNQSQEQNILPSSNQAQPHQQKNEIYLEEELSSEGADTEVKAQIEDDDNAADIEDGDRVDEEDEDDEEDDDMNESGCRQRLANRSLIEEDNNQQHIRISQQKRRAYIEDDDGTPPQRQGAVSSYDMFKKKYQLNAGAA